MVKNVTGYDLHKLLIGSLGTLAVITRVNFRTFPYAAGAGNFRRVIFCGRSCVRFLPRHRPLRPHAADGGSRRSRCGGICFFPGKLPTRINPRTGPSIISAAGQPAVVESPRSANSATWRVPRRPKNSCRLAMPNALSVLCPHSRIPAAGSGSRTGRGDFSDWRRARRRWRLLLAQTALMAAQARSGFCCAHARVGNFVCRVSCRKKDDARRLPPTMAGVIGEVFRTCAQPEMNASARCWNGVPSEVKTSRGDCAGARRARILS